MDDKAAEFLKLVAPGIPPLMNHSGREGGGGGLDQEKMSAVG